jgi:hypothetical protein
VSGNSVTVTATMASAASIYWPLHLHSRIGRIMYWPACYIIPEPPCVGRYISIAGSAISRLGRRTTYTFHELLPVGHYICFAEDQPSSHIGRYTTYAIHCCCPSTFNVNHFLKSHKHFPPLHCAALSFAYMFVGQDKITVICPKAA